MGHDSHRWVGQHQAYPRRGSVLLMGRPGGERWPAGTLTLLGKLENSGAPWRVLPGYDRAWGREDVPVAPPSVRGADNALANAARTCSEESWNLRLKPQTLEWACHPVDQ